MYPEPNTTRWEVGDLVLHKEDSKSYRMLMQVVGYTKTGDLCRTIYVYGPEYETEEGPQVWENPIGRLYDPAELGVDVNKDVALTLKPWELLRVLHHIRERERTLTYPILNQLGLDWQCW